METLDALPSIETDSYAPLRVQAYNVLREAILTGRLPPGEHLAEEKVCSELGVSRSPLREALRRLEAEGLVSILPRRGAIVTQLTRRDLADLFAVRKSLEALAASLAAGSITEEELTALDETCEAMEQSIALQDMPSVASLNSHLHEVMVGASRNKWLGTFLASLGDHIRRVYSSSIQNADRARQSVAEHRALIAALRKGDAETAERLARQHVERAEEAAMTSWFPIKMGVQGFAPPALDGGPSALDS